MGISEYDWLHGVVNYSLGFPKVRSIVSSVHKFLFYIFSLQNLEIQSDLNVLSLFSVWIYRVG